MITDKRLLEAIATAIQDKKGKKIIIADLRKIASLTTQYFVICQGTSTMQVTAIADHIRQELQERLQVKPYNYDGYQNAQWIVLDYGHIYVHVFLPEYRQFYNLEQLWSDAKLTEVKDLD